MKTRIIILLLSVFISTIKLNAQVAVNTDGSQPNSHAMLDIKSTDKGILIPRMTTTERATLGQNLTATEKGMMVFDMETNSLFYWNSSLWIEMSAQNYWKINGNSVPSSDVDFLGTTNAMPLNIFTDNTLHVRITTKGQIETLNTGGSIFLGKEAGKNDDLTDNNNIYIGDYAGFSGNAWATNTIAIGKNALRDNNGSSENIAIGNNTLMYNTLSGSNIAIGYEAF